MTALARLLLAFVAILLYPLWSFALSNEEKARLMIGLAIKAEEGKEHGR